MHPKPHTHLCQSHRLTQAEHTALTSTTRGLIQDDSLLLGNNIHVYVDTQRGSLWKLDSGWSGPSSSCISCDVALGGAR